MIPLLLLFAQLSTPPVVPAQKVSAVANCPAMTLSVPRNGGTIKTPSFTCPVTINIPGMTLAPIKLNLNGTETVSCPAPTKDANGNTVYSGCTITMQVSQ